MSDFGKAYYTNVLATIPLAIAIPLTGDLNVILNNTWTLQQVAPLLTSCVVGLLMSHASFCMRSATSATTFTVAGIVCKLITVLINYVMWDQHANAMGLGFLFVCLVAGSLYQQSPLRSTPASTLASIAANVAVPGSRAGGKAGGEAAPLLAAGGRSTAGR